MVCGAVSQYNATEPQAGPTNLINLLVARATMTGMVIFDFEAKFDRAREVLGRWLKDGRLISPEFIVPGQVSDFPETLLSVFKGENIGKTVLAISG